MSTLPYLNVLGCVICLAAFAMDVRVHASALHIAVDLLLAAANLYFVLENCDTTTEED